MAKLYVTSWRLKRRLLDPAAAWAALDQYAKFGARLEARRTAAGARRATLFVPTTADAVKRLQELCAIEPRTEPDDWEACATYELATPADGDAP